jgi:hypothetical protein
MKVRDFIVCEDVRSEIGNKISAMGILGDSLTLTMPANSGAPTLRLAFMIRLETETPALNAISFEFKIFANDSDLAGFQGAAAPGIDGIVTLPLVANLLQLPFSNGTGQLRFRLQVTENPGGNELLSQSFRPLVVTVYR